MTEPDDGKLIEKRWFKWTLQNHSEETCAALLTVPQICGSKLSIFKRIIKNVLESAIINVKHTAFVWVLEKEWVRIIWRQAEASYHYKDNKKTEVLNGEI